MAENTPPDSSTENTPKHFIAEAIDQDLASGRYQAPVVTRFPPEPNGYLHIGHAKSICLNFGLAEDYDGRCHLRFDDTNPEKEDTEYVEAIQEDIRWLGFDWGEHLHYASDYFDQLFAWARHLIREGKAYVDDSTAEEIAAQRGSTTRPGTESPYRSRSVEENLDLFTRMKAGEFEESSRVLRAKIDMASPNLHLRDPVLYRIRKQPHHRTGTSWCIYPSYDFAHGQSDAIEHITHSLCSLEFEVHRPLYEWLLANLPAPSQPRQIEFARLNLSHTVMSKRKLRRLVEEGFVSGWDDPRMPTISALRRRGFPPAAVRNFCDRVGITKRENVIELGLLEHFVREELNKSAPRVMAVLDPLKVVITNYQEGRFEELSAVNNPEDVHAGSRLVPFGREIYIERGDFMEDPPKKYFRLAPGKEVRLRWAYFITCEEVIKDSETGEVTELHCRYDPETRGGDAPDGRKVKGTLHWVSADWAQSAEVRLYETLFNKEDPEDAPEGQDYIANLNPDSLKTITAKVERSLAAANPGEVYQFERTGYFCADLDSRHDALIFNRTVSLKDSWAKKGGK